MIIAVAQTRITPDVRANTGEICALLERAAKAGARVVHCPEGALSGYAKSEIQSWDSADWPEVEHGLDLMASDAARLGVWVVVGSNHRLPSPLWPQNSLYVISDQGRVVARYNKRYCSHTEVTGWYTPGTAPVIFDVDGFRFGCALCIEVWFPELFAEYERLGVDCVLLSSYSKDPIYGVLARAHAATNCSWLSVAIPAQCSDLLPSMVVGPDGEVIVAAAAGVPDLALSPLDRDLPRYDIALRKARPWRARARANQIYPDRIA